MVRPPVVLGRPHGRAAEQARLAVAVAGREGRGRVVRPPAVLVVGSGRGGGGRVGCGRSRHVRRAGQRGGRRGPTHWAVLLTLEHLLAL